MLGKIIGKITGGESKLMTVALIMGPILVVAVLFILTHLLFTPKQPTSEEIVASIANKAMLGGIDPSIVGVKFRLMIISRAQMRILKVQMRSSLYHLNIYIIKSQQRLSPILKGMSLQFSALT